MLEEQTSGAAGLDFVPLYPLGSLCQTGAVSAGLTGSVTAGFRVLFVGAVAAVVEESPYLLPFGGSVGELTESVTADGEGAVVVGGGHGDGHEPETG